VSVFRSQEGRVRSGWVIALFGVVAIGVEAACVVAVELVGPGLTNQLEPKLFFSTLPSVLSGLTATVVCAFAFRENTALDARPLAPLAIGFGLGALAIGISVALPVLDGAQTLRLNHESSFTRTLLEFIALAPAGIGEELLLRGLAFQALRRGVGDRVAIALSSVLFGVLHLTNPHASWVAAAIITLVGLWFGAMMVRTGKIWVPMGLHLGWNFFEGTVFGQPVSGMTPGVPIFLAHWPAERGFWSGADFGPEAAGWTVVVLLVATALTIGAPSSSPPPTTSSST
jgi:membrane protease YdiL (CAAX protease family)